MLEYRQRIENTGIRFLINDWDRSRHMKKLVEWENKADRYSTKGMIY